MAPDVAAVAILDADPDLAEDIPQSERELARRQLMARVLDVPIGAWEPGDLGHRVTGALGVLVLGGLLTRSITMAGRTTGELLGVGDILRPWEMEEGVPPVPFDVRWSVLAPARLALLDQRFVHASARWPSILTQLSHRTVNRSRSLSLQLALGQVPRVDGRLLLLFWRLGDRWGRMTPDGILIPLRLTHEGLAALVAARRPSVTSALGRLAELGLLRRTDGGWLLAREVEAQMGDFLVTHDTRESSASASPASMA
jgi:CRP/FNR family cyclic AMP-dependent transcriptional regulator